jgi:hypothetical protein
VYYAHGTAKAEDLATLSKGLNLNDHVVINIADLIAAFRSGLADYLATVDSDPARKRRSESGVGLWFEEMHPEVVEDAIQRLGLRTSP